MISEVIRVVGSNILILISNILIGFVIPKLMGVQEYGYYKLFMLYATYAQLLHLGFVDGILLKFGGKAKDDVNRQEIRGYSKFIFFLELIIGVLFILISLFIKSYVYKQIFIFIGLYTMIFNQVTYYQFLAQSFMDFNLIAVINGLIAFLNILSILFIITCIKIHLFSDVTFNQYILIYLSIYVLILGIYIKYYGNFFGGIHTRFKNLKDKIINIFKIGIPVTISYQVAALIFNVDNQYVSLFYSTKIFGIYSFAYSLISVATSVINSVSTVLFPHLNRKGIDEAIKEYEKSLTLLETIIFLILFIYFPMKIFVKAFLPEYIKSLTYLRVLFPGVGITTCISLLVFNYFKVAKMGKIYFKLSIFTLLFSIVFTWLIHNIFAGPVAIAYASLISLFFWYLLTNGYLVIKYKIKWRKNTLYILLMFVIFEITTSVDNLCLSFFAYLMLYILIIVLVFGKNYLSIIKSICRK